MSDVTNGGISRLFSAGRAFKCVYTGRKLVRKREIGRAQKTSLGSHHWQRCNDYGRPFGPFCPHTSSKSPPIREHVPMCSLNMQVII